MLSRCEHLASLPGLPGRARPELRPGWRSIVFGNYVILFRHADDEGPRSHMYIGRIVDGRRDPGSYFIEVRQDIDRRDEPKS